MVFEETGIAGLIHMIPVVHTDSRGTFLEFSKWRDLEAHGIRTPFVQDNMSTSSKGVVRGLHLQLPPHDQAKLVGVISGKVLDVVVDVRKGSSTFGKVFTCVLDSVRRNQLYVPPGFAHGFAALEETIFFYKCSNYYSPGHETGIRWDDPELAIDWMVSNPVISTKDQALPTLSDLLRNSVISRD
ncbi:MAG: dTDP-4-dehydrorhamnose 3,5-epimerase [Cyclobacteriaceae bacterium]|nr:dTDP-4-dehydrorhamnose 3,5-epimerase [Cyclobacteriaceae bacterium]